MYFYASFSLNFSLILIYYNCENHFLQSVLCIEFFTIVKSFLEVPSYLLNGHLVLNVKGIPFQILRSGVNKDQVVIGSASLKQELE